MLDIGINVARIGEFAWRKMEPRDGEFDFSWLHFVVDKLKNAGLAIVMGTPTAVPPIWLTKKYPDMLVEYKNGRKMQHSGRRHACSNHPEYLKYSARIVEKMAQEFGKEEAIIGWQIDNEIYLQNNEGCFCDNCAKKYREHLKGSTKNIICGHNHVNNWVVKYDGVRFIFGTKTGSGSYWEPEINGGTVFTIDENGVESVRHEYVDISEFL
jgi:beta-galactosidase GanA